MHRATPVNTSFRSYVAGGSRSCVGQVDDEQFMQEMAGRFMANEERQAIESPQNYGFTSVVMDATRDAMGKIQQCAETFIGFMGGNRSFPVAGNMDDRRHRLYKLAKGDVAMFRTRDDQQQFHMTTDGGYWSAPDNKTVRMQLVPQQQQSQQQGAQQQDATGGGGGNASSSASSGQQQLGQEAVYKQGQNNGLYVHVTNNDTTASGTNVYMRQASAGVLNHAASDGQLYCGAQKEKGTFAKIVTTAGPCKNVWGNLGGGGALASVTIMPPGEPSGIDKLLQTVKALAVRVAALEARLP